MFLASTLLFNMPIHSASAKPLAVGNGEYTLPFGPEVGEVRVNMSGRLYQAEYAAVGLTGYDDSDYHGGSDPNRAAFDFAIAAGQRVLAAAPGKVVQRDNCQVVIQNEGTGEWVY